MRREIKNLRILLTGGSGGIGRTLASALVQVGAKVCNFARREEELKCWQDEQRNHPEHTSIFTGDVTRPEDRIAAVNHIAQLWGGLDCVINNAGVGAMGRLNESKPETLRAVFEVNFFAAVELTRVSLPHLQKGTRPIVVNIGSILGHRATPQYSEYCASKFALRGWSESVRPELAKLGIDLLLVNPGPTESDFHKHKLGSHETAPWQSASPVSSEVVAQKTVQAMRKGALEIIPSGSGKFLVLANRICPNVVSRFMNKWG